MRTLLQVIVCAGILAMNVMAASITFDVDVVGTTGTGETLYRYTYSFASLTLGEDTEVDIRFSPTVYGMLLNPVAPLGFDVLVLQPNNPPGTFGDYSALAMVDNPPLDGPFTVDFTLLGSAVPGSQQFFINQIADDGTVTRLDSGFTTPIGAVPEPATFVLVAAGVLAAGVARARYGTGRGRAI